MKGVAGCLLSFNASHRLSTCPIKFPCLTLPHISIRCCLISRKEKHYIFWNLVDRQKQNIKNIYKYLTLTHDMTLIQIVMNFTDHFLPWFRRVGTFDWWLVCMAFRSWTSLNIEQKMRIQDQGEISFTYWRLISYSDFRRVSSFFL